MRNLPIAYGNSCFAKTWSNKTITFDELCVRMEQTIRTTESVEEYQKLAKTERDRIKDKGGFVGGQLRDNRRKRENVACRSMLTLDCDHADVGFIVRFIAGCKHAACIYTTHGHTPEAPRVRVLVPMSRDVTPDEFVAISRYFADEWGIDQFDECSYRPHQLMYWPTTPANGEYLCKRVEGAWLDPDAYLARYPNWKDCSLLPTSSRESAVRESSRKPQEDPLAKEGVIGAFCRTYGVEAAIATFLSDVYEPSLVDGRYDYIAADSSAGVVIYDDKFVYSHHATDPACGKLLNAFDLVRMHKFADDDDKKSFAAMMDFASKDDQVKLLMTQERVADASQEFDELEDWRKQLKYMTRSSVLENSVWNLNLILNNDPDFAGFAYNELANRIQVTGDLPWERPEGNLFWRDADTAQLKSLIDARYLPFSSRNHDVAFMKAADDRHFHPIRDYLDALPTWDGVTRVEDLFITYLKADNTTYVRAVTRKTFAAAVARIYRPGVKFDCVPVLDGEQGIGKSSIVKDLVTPEYYSESLSLTDMDDKSGAEKLQGFWVVEIGELAGMKKADIEKVKSFLSTSDDKYRPSYGRTVESHPRQCVIIATVNGERGYLRDITGNRRFWIIKLHQQKQKQKWRFDQLFRDQFWAEAKAIYDSGETLYLEGDLLDAAEEAQRGAMEVDERIGMVEEYLTALLPENWDRMDIYSRREYLSDTNSPLVTKGTIKRSSVSNAEIWCECFGRSLQDLKPTDSYAIAALMTQVPGWERTKTTLRQPIYGKQRLYTRI
ncbi:MAG: virulence-associated E family protein [Christensenella sp.]|nr:virulence-associated E family protein [Christensenella sp.]